MNRRLQFSLRWLLVEIALIAVVLGSVLSIGGHGPSWNACFTEIAATTFGAAIGMLWGKPLECAAYFWFFGLLGLMI